MDISYDNAGANRLAATGASVNFLVADKSYVVAMTDSHGTSMTFNGVSMDSLSTFTSPISDGNGATVKVWGTYVETGGTYSFVVTTDNQPTPFAYASYALADTTQFDNSTSFYSNNGTNNTQVVSLSASITPNTDACWVIQFVTGGNNANRLFTGGTGTTLRATVADLDINSVAILDSNGAIDPAASTTLIATWASGSGYISSTIASLLALPDTGEGNFFLVL
jgi:hypothetical protein